MSKITDKMKEELIEEIFSETELDNYMDYNRFVRVQENENEKDEIIKYMNDRHQIWIECTRDEENNILISDVKYVTKQAGMTKVSRFLCMADYINVLEYFYNKGQYHHWLCGILCAALGRRIGDIINLKWSDIYFQNGKFRERLTTLKEEKTGKTIGIKLKEYPKSNIIKYQELLGININEVYNHKIFSTTTSGFRAALKKSVDTCGITYEVSTHSFRKFHGFLMYELHRSDPQAMNLIQLEFGHTDINITKEYIGVTDDELDFMGENLSNHFLAYQNGKIPVIENKPTITLNTDDFRNLLIEAGADSTEKLKEMLDKTEKISINYR